MSGSSNLPCLPSGNSTCSNSCASCTNSRESAVDEAMKRGREAECASGCGSGCGDGCGSGCDSGCGGGCGSKKSDALAESQVSDALLDAPEHVLSTLEKDGTRRWIKPKLSKGSWWHRRRIVAYGLMIFFVLVPHLRINGLPVIRLDIVAREFTILGHVFLPTDTLLVALLLLMAFVGIVFLTTVMGRAWCGWACPQTVYIEFLFRPLDRLFEGTVGRGGKSRREISAGMQILRFATYLLLTSFLAHTFLAYFVGTEKLAIWLTRSPFEHPAAFLVMAITTGLLTYDFYFFREQTCLIACPYGRFQSTMLDRQSLIVAYDGNRGEPRAKGRRTGDLQVGDCVDCNQCVVVCPTGIDIRNGLQMECINCTQCIDACDAVMEKVHQAPGLIRYTSQDELDRKPWKFLRVRTVIYPVILSVLGIAFLFAASTKYSFDARILRSKGAPFSLNTGRANVTNAFNLHIVNRSSGPQEYSISILEPANVQLEVIDPLALQVEKGSDSMVPIHLSFPGLVTAGDGNEPVMILVTDSDNNQVEKSLRLLGPR